MFSHPDRRERLVGARSHGDDGDFVRTVGDFPSLPLRELDNRGASWAALGMLLNELGPAHGLPRRLISKKGVDVRLVHDGNKISLQLRVAAMRHLSNQVSGVRSV